MAVKVNDIDGKERVLPEVQEVGERIDDKVSEERTRAEEAEVALDSALQSETVRAKEAEENIIEALNNEIERSEQVDNNMDTRISDEVSRAMGKEAELDTAIQSEITRAKEAEEALSEAKVDKIQASNRVYATDYNGDFTSDLSYSQYLAPDIIVQRTRNKEILVPVVPSRNDSAASADYVGVKVSEEKARAEGAEQALDTKIAKEKERAEGVETAISSSLTSEITRATTKESELGTSISEETARAQGAEAGLDTRIGDIEKKVPEQASETNQLADKDFVNSTINSAAAFYIGEFESKAALDAWQIANPDKATNNDYAYISSDETHNGEAWRYTYTEKDGSGVWKPQFRVNEAPFTSEQLYAINSTITKEKVQAIDRKVEKSSAASILYGTSIAGDNAVFAQNAFKDRIYIGQASSPTNSAAGNGEVHLKLYTELGDLKSQYLISGSGVSVTSDENGNITVSRPEITVDSQLSTTSENPVQNKAVTAALNEKYSPDNPQPVVVTATATVDNTVGTPNVTVTKSGTSSNPALNFAFTGLRGNSGHDGVDGAIHFVGIISKTDGNDYYVNASYKITENYGSNKIYTVLISQDCSVDSYSFKAGDVVRVTATGRSVGDHYMDIQKTGIEVLTSLKGLKGNAGAIQVIAEFYNPTSDYIQTLANKIAYNAGVAVGNTIVLMASADSSTGQTAIKKGDLWAGTVDDISTDGKITCSSASKIMSITSDIPKVEPKTYYRHTITLSVNVSSSSTTADKLRIKLIIDSLTQSQALTSVNDVMALLLSNGYTSKNNICVPVAILHWHGTSSSNFKFFPSYEPGVYTDGAGIKLYVNIINITQPQNSPYNMSLTTSNTTLYDTVSEVTY